jgi:hypothetical protein
LIHIMQIELYLGEQIANMIDFLVPLKTCTVVIEDLKNTTHSVDVTAGSLYEAVAQGACPSARTAVGGPRSAEG